MKELLRDLIVRTLAYLLDKFGFVIMTRTDFNLLVDEFHGIKTAVKKSGHLNTARQFKPMITRKIDFKVGRVETLLGRVAVGR